MLLNWEVNLINQIVNCTNNIHGVLGAGAIFFLDIPPAHEYSTCTRTFSTERPDTHEFEF